MNLFPAFEFAVEYLVFVGVRPARTARFIKPLPPAFTAFEEEIAEFRTALLAAFPAERIHLYALDRLFRHKRSAHLLPAVRPLVEIGPFPPGDGTVGVIDIKVDAVFRNRDIPRAAFASVDDRRRVGIFVEELLPHAKFHRLGICRRHRHQCN